MKRQGYLDMYNGIDVVQTCHCIMISCTSYVNKICDKYLQTWMRNYTSTDDRPTLLPSDPAWMKKFNAAIGNPDPKVQARLGKTMDISYRSGVGELIWAMTTCQPDIAYAGVKLSQANACPHEHHFHGVKHALKYLYSTKMMVCFTGALLLAMSFQKARSRRSIATSTTSFWTKCPEYDAHVLHAYADWDWASCIKTR